MNIQTRAALMVLALIVLLGAAGFAVALLQMGAVEHRVDVHTLETAQTIQRQVEQTRRRELELTSSVVATNPSFVGYIAQALSVMDIPGQQVDTASIRDLLEERRTEFGFDFAAVLDANGRGVVMAGEALRSPPAFADMPLVTKARTEAVAATGLWTHNGQLLLVSIAPMLRGSTLEGLLLSGYEVDAEFAKPIAQTARVGVALLSVAANTRSITASTLDAVDGERLLAALDAWPVSAQGTGAPDAGNGFTVRLSGGDTRIAISPLFGTAETGLLVSVIPFEQKVATGDAIRQPLLIAGAFALLVILIFAWIVQNRLLKPVNDLADLSERMLRGDFQLVAKTAGTGAISRIGAAINHILAELRGFKEAIEQRRGRP